MLCGGGLAYPSPLEVVLKVLVQDCNVIEGRREVLQGSGLSRAQVADFYAVLARSYEGLGEVSVGVTLE